MKRVIGTLAVLATVAVTLPAMAQDLGSTPPGTSGSNRRPAVQDPAITQTAPATSAPTGGLRRPATESIPMTPATGANVGVQGDARRPGVQTNTSTNAGTMSPSVASDNLAQPVPSANPRVMPAPMAAPMAGTMMVSPADRRFARGAAQGNAAEIMMAKLALTKSANPDVKSFAQKMIDDHSDAGMKLKAIADAKGMTLPMGPDAAHRAAYNRLSRLHGAAFDRSYLAGQKTDHMKMLSMMNAEASNGKDADLKGFAAATAPTVQSHLDMLQKMPMGAPQS